MEYGVGEGWRGPSRCFGPLVGWMAMAGSDRGCVGGCNVFALSEAFVLSWDEEMV